MSFTGNIICIIVSIEEVGPLGIKLFHIKKSNRKGRIACMERFDRVRHAQVGSFSKNINDIWKEKQCIMQLKPSSPLDYQHKLNINSKQQLPSGKKFSSEREQIQLKQ